MGELVPFKHERPLWVDAVILICAAGLFASLIALGTWQLNRLAWKTALIEAVDTRAFAAPVAAPLGSVTRDDHVYLRVVIDGFYRHDLSQRVKAVTALGPGFWVMTPLRTGTRYIWINRGFVPLDLPEEDWERPQGEQHLVGLLRITEPRGTLLETNNPSAGRWYSRDVSELSAHVGLGDAAEYFVDVEHQLQPQDWPRGGLTRIAFRNQHLSYALTWYTMALLLFLGMTYAIWDRLRLRVRKSRARRVSGTHQSVGGRAL